MDKKIYRSIILILIMWLLIFVPEISAEVVSITLTNEDQDGHVYEWWTNFSGDTSAQAGDAGGLNLMAFLGINLENIPEAANITAATIFFYINGEVGNPGTNNPYLVDHIDFGPDIKLDDMSTGAIENGSNFNFFTYPGVNGWIAVPCSVQVASASTNAKPWTLDGSDRWFQTRIRASNLPDNGPAQDSFRITASEHSSNNWHPYLKIHFDVDHTLSHFVISHDTDAQVNSWEKITVTAEDSNNFTIWSNIGTVTIYVTGASGTIIWSNGNNCGGPFINLGSNIAYTFTGCEHGVIELYIRDDTEESVDVEIISSDSGQTDDGTDGELGFILQMKTTCFLLDYGKQDGYVEEYNDVNTGDIQLNAGDQYGTNIMSFLGINLKNIPQAATITAATMYFYIYGSRNNPEANNPYLIDHMDFGTDIGFSDITNPTILSNNFYSFDFITEDRQIAVPVTAQVAFDSTNVKPWALDGSDRWFQTRIRAGNIVDNTNRDFMRIASSENPSTNRRPGLCVYYKVNHAPDHFVISHATNYPIYSWEKITVTAKDKNNFTVWSNIGTVTISVEGADGDISWLDIGYCGTFTNLGSNIAYTFTGCEKGVIELYIRDNSVDTVEIEISSVTGLTDDDTEGTLYFFIKPVTASIILTNGNQDGHVADGMRVSDGSSEMKVGDEYDTSSASSLRLDSFIGINLNNIPPEVFTVTAATLYFWAHGDRNNPAINNPYVVDHLDFGKGIGFSDMSEPAIQSNFYSFDHPGGENFWVAVPCMDQVIYDLANPKSWSLDGSDKWFQIRIQASNIAANTGHDYMKITTSENDNIDKHPYLSISYYQGHILTHFEISHDNGGVVNEWEKITVTAKNTNGLTIWSNIGTVTVSVTGDNGDITWSNGNNCGTFTNFNNETVAYTFAGCEDGVITLYIKDDRVDTVDIVVNSDSGKTDYGTEGELVFYDRTTVSIGKFIDVPAATNSPGDYVRFRIDYTNNGAGPAIGVMITDSIPAGTVYVPNSLSNSISGPLTDDAGGEGYCDGNEVIFCVTNGQAPSVGGTLDPGVFGSLYFTVKISTNYSPVPNYLELNRGFIAEVYSSGAGTTYISEAKVGDLQSSDLESRALFSFNLPPYLSTGSFNITGATLYFYREDFEGSDSSITNIDPVHIDLVELGEGFGPGDYDSTVYTSNIAVLALDPTERHYIPVTDALNKTINNLRTKFQLRIRPDAIVANSSNDYWPIYTFRASRRSRRPELYIYYSTNFPVDGVTNRAIASGVNFYVTSATTSFPVTQPPDAEVSILKSIDNISMTNLSGYAMPGSLITFKLKYTNTDTIAARIVKVTDPILSGLTYYPGSLRIGGLGSSYSSASNLTDSDEDDQGRYYNGEVIFCISNGIAPYQPGNVNTNSGGCLYYKASINPSAVPSVPVSNTANIFGLNFDLTNSTAFTNVAIQYGGEFSFISDNARGAVGKINFFSASFVNKGNDQRSFSFAIAAATNSDGAVWTNWDMKIVETDSTNELSSWTLDPKERADFRIMITA